MRHDQRQRVLVTRPDVDEVDVEPVEVRHELRQGIQPRLELPPVIAAAPVAHEFLDLGQLGTLGLVSDGLLIGPARRSDAPPQIGQVRHVDFERADARIGHGGHGVLRLPGWAFTGPR
jgi:hypothetical protein